MKNKSLTLKQSEIIDFINNWNNINGAPPTHNEISEHFGYHSPNAVREHLRLIEQKGYIRLLPGKARGIQIISKGKHRSSKDENQIIPILGRIAAGTPIMAEQNYEAYLPITPSNFGGQHSFALRISGDSMIQAGILNGDLAVVEKQKAVNNGEIAAVLIEEEATLKRFYHRGKKIILKAENPAYKDIEIIGNNGISIHILGKLLGIVRGIREIYL